MLKMTRFGWLLVALATFICDQGLKTWLFQTSDSSSGVFLFPSIVRLTTYRNLGIAMSLPVPKTLILVLSSLAIALVIFIGYKKIQNTLWNQLGFGLLIGGAIGNLYDRLTLGFVRDWLLLFERSAINFADMAIVLGLVLLAFYRPVKNPAQPETKPL